MNTAAMRLIMSKLLNHNEGEMSMGEYIDILRRLPPGSTTDRNGSVNVHLKHENPLDRNATVYRGESFMPYNDPKFFKSRTKELGRGVMLGGWPKDEMISNRGIYTSLLPKEASYYTGADVTAMNDPNLGFDLPSASMMYRINLPPGTNYRRWDEQDSHFVLPPTTQFQIDDINRVRMEDFFSLFDATSRKSHFMIDATALPNSFDDLMENYSSGNILSKNKMRIKK